MEENNKKYPEGHFIGMWMGIGIAIFSGVGVAISISLKIPGLIGIGPAMGISLGLAIGSSIESKYKNDGKIRPLTEVEKKNRNTVVIAGIIAFLIGLGVFLVRKFL